MILKDVHFSIGGNDLTGYVKQLSFDQSVEVQDNTTMGSNSRTKEPGLKDASGSVTFKQDFSAVDAVLSSAMGSTVDFAFRQQNEAVSLTNPEFSGQMIISAYNPIAGGVGESQEATISFDVTGDVTRATA